MQEKFLQLFKETLDIEDKDIQMTDEFRSFDEWDSIANLSVIAMIDDEYDVVIENSDFKNIKTLQELWEEIGKRR
jgi:acyl carrier protein